MTSSVNARTRAGIVNAGVASARIVGRHPDHQAPIVAHDARSARTLPRVRPPQGDQLAVSAKNRAYLVSTSVSGNSRVVTVQVFWQVLQTYLSVRSPLCLVTSMGAALPRQ